jgi:hypothetical protein
LNITDEFFHFAITLLEQKSFAKRIHSRLTDRIPPIHAQKAGLAAILWRMAGIPGRSGPPGNQNALDTV